MALVVAHPDDESLWGAGLIIRYPGDWTIICCTIPFRDPERIDRFSAACDVLGARGIVLGHPERDGLIPVPDLSGFDVVVTHGPNGEYGHPQHIELHNSVKNKSAWFGYGGRADRVIELTEDEWQRKLAAIKCYDHYSSSDQGLPKWQALVNYYGKKYNLKREPYGLPNFGTDGAKEKSHSAAGFEAKDCIGHWLRSWLVVLGGGWAWCEFCPWT